MVDSEELGALAVAVLLTMRGFSSSKSLYIDSNEAEPLSQAHAMSENRGDISVTSTLKGVRLTGAIGFFYCLAALDISERYCFFWICL